MPSRGSASRAEGNQTLRAVCANCGRSIPTEVGHAHPLDEALRRETWGLVGLRAEQKMVFPTCVACYDAGWRPPGFVSMN
jgi:5-methylcytosine-specific restriction endonuclease McrA